MSLAPVCVDDIVSCVGYSLLTGLGIDVVLDLSSVGENLAGTCDR